jgi:hypothetical protein
MAVALTQQDLGSAAWLELAGHDPSSLADAWYAAHYASLAVSEVGQAFAVPKPDNSHAAMEWFGGENLLDGFLAGAVVGTTRRIRAALRLWDLRLFLIEPNGRARAELGLVGETAEASLGWVVSAALDVLDEPIRQATAATPDMPDHALGRGAVFDEVTGIAQAELIRLYANTAAVLERARDRLTDQGVETEPVRVSPRGLAISTTVVLTRSAEGAASHTVGLGLAPPDGTVAAWSAGPRDDMGPGSALPRDDEGYWFVSVHGRGDASAATPESAADSLPFGRWTRARDGAWLAVLPVSQVTATEDPVQQIARLTGFLSVAFGHAAPDA